jgi:hypothetical protein
MRPIEAMPMPLAFPAPLGPRIPTREERVSEHKTP